MNTHHTLVLEMKKILGMVGSWLDKAAAHAEAKKFEPDTLLQARLAPDMFPLIRQIQFTCDQARNGAARLAGKEPPSHADTEKTMAEIRQRVATVIAYLDGFGEADFAGAEGHKVSLPRWEGKSMSASDYFAEHAQPNFFFHATTAYLLLRHNGVDVGKRDFLGALSMK